ncbi:hypothetical protein [Arthrobacter flavus]|uniref:Uncharacterized protein n=1 Tax=Arthrobacter flavus TaxID=95172 RepID=A0ABW4QBK3_9MICC
MSKHPGNPYWCQTHDNPTGIYTRGDWDEAVAGGHITPEHVWERLYRIAIGEFGVMGPAGYDEDGFFLSLTAEGLVGSPCRSPVFV